MALLYLVAAVGLVIASIAAFAGQPSGGWAIGILGVAMVLSVVIWQGRVHPADLWLAGGPLAAGAAGVALRGLRMPQGEGSDLVRLLLRVGSGVVGLFLALMAGSLAWFAAGGMPY